MADEKKYIFTTKQFFVDYRYYFQGKLRKWFLGFILL